MEHADYFRDTIQEPYTVLGLRLKPLSAGHIIRLHQIESSFLLGGQRTIEDLALSVLVCSLNWEEGQKALLDPQLDRFMSRWQKKLCGQWGLRYWLGLKKSHPIDLPEKFRLFEEYLIDGLKIPNHQFESNNPRETGCPLVLWVLNKLESKTNWTRVQLLDRPWKETVWDWLTVECQEGNILGFVGKKQVEAMNEGEADAMKLAEQFGLRKIDGNI